MECQIKENNKYIIPTVQQVMTDIHKEEYTFGKEDLYQDIDAYNMHNMLNFLDICSAFIIYYDTNKTYWANRRFSNFVIERVTNGITGNSSNLTKLNSLAENYVSKNIFSTSGIFGTAFYVLFNYNYDTTTYASNVANAFANKILNASYFE